MYDSSSMVSFRGLPDLVNVNNKKKPDFFFFYKPVFETGFKNRKFYQKPVRNQFVQAVLTIRFEKKTGFKNLVRFRTDRPTLGVFVSEHTVQVIQNSAVRYILKLQYDIHQEAFNKLKLLTVSNRLFELSERYVEAGLSHSVPLVVCLNEYREGFESRYIEYPTPLYSYI
ncbi:hypothetical protein BpHYR1_041903 [Brachionus plicatilis]|uniref:Uncharacterized protein n=1 Tax=Brachionus plicatilis TaxID=10195 RepID=A0A3M7S1R1_BRAPC|nr:hypothetical protein BpHYR1_041903 [Brachionus plicatilis]